MGAHRERTGALGIVLGGERWVNGLTWSRSRRRWRSTRRPRRQVRRSPRPEVLSSGDSGSRHGVRQRVGRPLSSSTRPASGPTPRTLRSGVAHRRPCRPAFLIGSGIWMPAPAAISEADEAEHDSTNPATAGHSQVSTTLRYVRALDGQVRNRWRCFVRSSDRKRDVNGPGNVMGNVGTRDQR